jgi:hypothetical protein
MKIEKIKSKLPLTEYAPYWNLSIGRDVWTDFDKVDKIRNWLISNEDRIKALEVNHDAGTGLGNDSVTSRFGQYNLFDFSDELPELKDLLKFIRVSYLEFIVQDRTDIFELEIVCWFNFLRNNETVEEHIHGAAHDSYLSGNIHLDDYKTQTYYRCPQEPNLVFNSSNIKGGMTIFPSHMPHGATTYNETKPRISIAFDLRVMPDDNRLDYCSRPFMNPEIYSELVDEFKSQTYQELKETNN